MGARKSTHREGRHSSATLGLRLVAFEQAERTVDNVGNCEMPSTKEQAPQHEVAIYVAEHCSLCAYAYEIAELIRREFPAVAVRLVDLEQADEPIPESVFATPTYLIDGRRWSLGNPSPTDVINTLSKLE